MQPPLFIYLHNSKTNSYEKINFTRFKHLAFK